MNNGGKMERSKLSARTGMRYALLNPILEEWPKRAGLNCYRKAWGFDLAEE